MSWRRIDDLGHLLAAMVAAAGLTTVVTVGVAHADPAPPSAAQPANGDGGETNGILTFYCYWVSWPPIGYICVEGEG